MPCRPTCLEEDIWKSCRPSVNLPKDGSHKNRLGWNPSYDDWEWVSRGKNQLEGKIRGKSGEGLFRSTHCNAGVNLKREVRPTRTLQRVRYIAKWQPFGDIKMYVESNVVRRALGCSGSLYKIIRSQWKKHFIGECTPGLHCSTGPIRTPA